MSLMQIVGKKAGVLAASRRNGQVCGGRTFATNEPIASAVVVDRLGMRKEICQRARIYAAEPLCMACNQPGHLRIYPWPGRGRANALCRRCYAVEFPKRERKRGRRGFARGNNGYER